MRARARLGWFVPLSILLTLPSPGFAADPAGIAFFEQKIRPVLVKHCYKCHSTESEKVRGKLLLDSRPATLKGGETGPAVVPGKLTESLLIKAIRHDEIAMPPGGKLPDEVIADFERWVKMGAPDPRDGKVVASKGIDVEAGRKFWAFQPPRKSEPPKVSDTSWPRGDIDRFLLAAMEAKGVSPGADADRRPLIRRVTLDLIGLPPTPEEIDAFLHDKSTDALAKVVDGLLASPHFGERWGRHWLDLARYADSNGKDENLTFHEAFHYRDYVIDSFNRDKPFDRFIVEQIAGDLMPGDSQAERDEQLTGTGFLVVGPKVLADRDFVKRKWDVVDEQIDTVGKTFLGLTLGCARCHDHKFDPIPQTDYYALAGIFGNTRTLDGIKLGNAVVSGWMLRPVGGAEAEKKLAAHKEHQQKLAALVEQIKKVKAELKEQEDRAAMRLPGKLAGITVDDKDAKVVGTWKASVFAKPYVGEGYIHDDKMNKGEKSVTFTPKLPRAGEYEVYVSYTASKGRSTSTPVTVRHAAGEITVKINQEETPKVDGLFWLVGKYRFEEGEKGFVTISNKDTVGYVIVDAVRFVPVGALDEKEMAMGVPEQVRKNIADAQARLKKLEDDEKAQKAAAPPPPTLVMAVRDEDKIADAQVAIRGNPHSLGPAVPRGFVSVASTSKASIPEKQSGRLELAQWIASPTNPLTARVLVNRVWLHLFGEGIVRTVDNFGIQGERPSHPELLDTLAVRFIEDGWSVKKLIRKIVLSRAYQLACLNDPKAMKADPETRLFWRASRRRLEAEVIRDGILRVSGKLDRAPGGTPVPGLGERAIDNDSKGGVPTDANLKRSVYLPVIRNDLVPIFEVFDFADPEVTTGKRDATTVATQALYLMNSPFVQEQARAMAKRLLTLASDESRVRDLYLRSLGREPTAKETETALKFVAEYRKTVKGSKADPDVEAWAGVCLAIFGSTEFRFVE